MSILRYRTRLLAGITACTVFFVTATPAFAYTISSVTAEVHNDFVLEPGKMEVVVNPGDQITKFIAVTNRIKQAVDFKVEVEDFIGSRDPNNPVILLGGDKSPYSFRDNLKPEITDFTLNFGERMTLPVVIDVPKDAQPGGYYASVLVSNAPSKDGESDSSTTLGRTKIISRLGILFFIRVAGPVNQEGALQDFKIQGPPQVIYPKSPEGFEILFENTGSIHLVPYGLVTIKNTIGKAVATLPVDAYFSLPNSLRYRTIMWNDKGFRLGRYTATLNLNRGYNNVSDTRTITFWIIPWKILVTIIGVIALLTFIIYYMVSRFEFRRKK